MDMNDTDTRQENATSWAQLIVSHCIGIMSSIIERERAYVKEHLNNYCFLVI